MNLLKRAKKIKNSFNSIQLPPKRIWCQHEMESLTRNYINNSAIFALRLNNLLFFFSLCEIKRPYQSYLNERIYRIYKKEIKAKLKNWKPLRHIWRFLHTDRSWNSLYFKWEKLNMVLSLYVYTFDIS